MKKLFLTMGVAALLVACGGNGNQESQSTEESVVVDSTTTVSETTEVEVADEVVSEEAPAESVDLTPKSVE